MLIDINQLSGKKNDESLDGDIYIQDVPFC